VTIPAGVKIAGSVLVGGLSPAEAMLRVSAWFSRPLTIRAGTSTFRPTPQLVGAASYVGDAVAAARRAKPGTNVPLKVRVSQAHVERYVARLALRYDRSSVDSRLFLRNGKPYVTPERTGRRAQQQPVVAAVLANLRAHTRAPVRLRFTAVRPQVTRATIGPVIVIRRDSKRLGLYSGMTPVRSFGIATGQPQYPTPLGNFRIVVKWRNPWWYPPASDWAKDAKPIPPGPGNPLGTRWMGISSPAVGIHGTPDAASIGYSASHGCIRMLIPEVEWLFERVGIGTPVFIIR
jgi:lipoprotein-anchoring transpeptidase ErfK/SrfK